MSEYPEHEKVAKFSDWSNLIGDFIEWLACEGYASTEIFDIYEDINPLLAKYFGINYEDLMIEKGIMLQKVREANDYNSK